MLNLRVRLLDFMDSMPYADVPVRIEVRVMAGWLARIFVVPGWHRPRSTTSSCAWCRPTTWSASSRAATCARCLPTRGV